MATKKNRRKRSGQRSKPKLEFRSRVETEVVDQLLHRFVALVKHGLELMLRAPSELVHKEGTHSSVPKNMFF